MKLKEQILESQSDLQVLSNYLNKTSLDTSRDQSPTNSTPLNTSTSKPGLKMSKNNPKVDIPIASKVIRISA